MNKQQSAALVFATAVEMLCELEAMRVANMERERRGESLAYSEEAFNDLHDRYANVVSYNGAIEIFHNAQD